MTQDDVLLSSKLHRKPVLIFRMYLYTQRVDVCTPTREVIQKVFNSTVHVFADYQTILTNHQLDKSQKGVHQN